MIDLSTCIPGQEVFFQNGQIGFVTTSRRRSGNTEMRSVGCNLSWSWYTLDGIQGKDLPDPEWRIVEILPVRAPAEPSMIDLRTCIPGQRVRYRNNDTGAFVGPNDGGEGSFPFLTEANYSDTTFSHTKNGEYNWSGYRHPYDVVEILPMETPTEQPMIDLSTCVPGQKVRFANGKIGVFGKALRRSGTIKLCLVRIADDLLWWFTLDGSDYTHDSPDPEWQIVEILPVETPAEQPTSKPEEMDYKAAYLQIANIISVAFPECEVTTVDMARLLVNENRTLRLALGLPTYEEVEDLTYTEVYG